MKRYVHDKNPVELLKDIQDQRSDIASNQDIQCNYDEYDEDSIYEFVDRKRVIDPGDGFLTEYSLYYDVLNDRYVTVFGDHELYTPEDGYFDAEFETEAEAREFFYGAYEDDDEEID